MSYSQPSRGLTLLLLTLILVVAAVLRLGSLDTMEYKHDEGDMVQMVSQLVDEGQLLIKAERSTRGPRNSPLPAYILAPVWVVEPSPLAIAWFIALLNVAAVGVTYWIGQRFLGPRAGLIAAACFAVSPWAVMFSRNIWRPDMMPLFQALLIAATLSLIVKRRKVAVFWVLLLCGLLVQLYFTGFLPVIAALLLLVIYRPAVSRKALVLGLAIVALLFLPYGLFLAGGGWRDFFNLRADEAVSLLHRIDWAWHLVNLGNFTHLAGESFSYVNAELGLWAYLLYPLAAVERCVFIGGLGWLLWRVLRPGGEPNLRPVGTLLVLMIALPSVVCLAAPWPSPPRYYITMLPAPFLVIGVAVDSALTRLQKKMRSAGGYKLVAGFVGLIVAGTFLTQVHFMATFFSYLRSKGGTSGEYAVAYRHKVALADHLAEAYGPDCFRLNHQWLPLYGIRMGREIDGLVRHRASEGLCHTPEPVQLYLLETIDRPLSPEAEAGITPYERFGPVVLYKKAARDGS